MTRRVVQSAAVLLAAGAWTAAAAQTPLPFPKPGEPQKPPAQTAPQDQRVAPPRPAAATQDPQAPTEATLGMPIYPTADFITSYDAGRGQRYYLFGTNATFTDIVNYYRSVLRQRGELVYDEPPVHMFDVGRFREATMAFPPGVSVKDYTWGGSQGYLNPTPGAQTRRYRTIIQIVPAPPGARR